MRRLTSFLRLQVPVWILLLALAGIGFAVLGWNRALRPSTTTWGSVGEVVGGGAAALAACVAVIVYPLDLRRRRADAKQLQDVEERRAKNHASQLWISPEIRFNGDKYVCRVDNPTTRGFTQITIHGFDDSGQEVTLIGPWHLGPLSNKPFETRPVQDGYQPQTIVSRTATFFDDNADPWDRNSDSSTHRSKSPVPISAEPTCDCDLDPELRPAIPDGPIEAESVGHDGASPTS